MTRSVWAVSGRAWLFRAVAAACFSMVAASGCDRAPRRIELPSLGTRPDDTAPPLFICKEPSSRDCVAGTHYSCREDGEFLESVEVDCTKKGMVCDREQVCVPCHLKDLRCKVCAAGDADCNPNTVQVCKADKQGKPGWVDQQVCELATSDVCSVGACVNACELAKENRSYVGCEFYGADLDNAAIDDQHNAAAQQFAVAVANPQSVPVNVWVEQNDAAFGSAMSVKEVARALVAPGDLQVFKLPRRELDGSSENGLNDGTHTAVTSNAYKISSSHPVTVYQFNPLENVSVFSNDASLILPISAIGNSYTIVSWPETIGDSKNPEQDFDHTSSNEDLRAFLTIIGTTTQTHVHVQLGGKVKHVVGAGPVPALGNGGVLDLDIGPFDVINLETQGLNADFTGSVVTASQPVTVFVGSEASDAPVFGTYETRQCCADHLEEQLLPDVSAGTSFVVARMPQRTKALSEAAAPGMPLGVSVINEPEWIRVVSIQPGNTHVTTSLPGPFGEFTLKQRDDVILRADQDFVINSDKPIAVLQVPPSQGVSGIPSQYPGGDPSIITVPPVEQFRRDYIFLTPDKYAFDFVTIVAHEGSQILLDGLPLPKTCITTPIDASIDAGSATASDWVAHRCQLSFPVVTAGARSMVSPGEQHDGVHSLVSNREIGIVVFGFDRFVSYAYVGGLDLRVLN